MEVENSTNAARALRYIKETLHVDPEIIIHDLSPNLIKGTTEVFGYEKIGFDPFHVMQSLNRAIGKDLTAFRKTHFSNESNELVKLRKYISQIQKRIKSGAIQEQKQFGDLPEINPKNSIATTCLKFTAQVLSFLSIKNPETFFFELESHLEAIKGFDDLNKLAFALAIEEKLPKMSFSKKSQKRVISELLRKLKTYFHDCRIPLEEEQKKFNKMRWALFYQPEKLTDKRKQILDDLLSRYPSLQVYRDLTLRIGSLYRLPYDQVSETIILETPVRKEYGEELKTCLTTLKKHVDCVLRFKEFFENNPKLPRRCRANMEFQNTKVKKIIKSGNNLKSMKRIEKELQLHLGGEVRNFVSAL